MTDDSVSLDQPRTYQLILDHLTKVLYLFFLVLHTATFSWKPALTGLVLCDPYSSEQGKAF